MMRSTRQRDAIRQAIEEAGRPVAADEILALAQNHVPRLGMATVYRAIRDLLDQSWLRTVELPGETTRYERNDL
ncbi:MAG: transcriptional repressor, partial [Candidatus Eremiobacteraeota bacterium]|nr:transcriptional repressor [Candidatus Eremiobacteraeota bacterium]